MPNVWDRSGGDPRGRSQNQQGYYQGQSESQSGPLADWTAQNAGYWGQQAQQGYNPLMQQFQQFGGFAPQGGGYQQGPPQSGPMQQQGGGMQQGGMTPDQAYQQASTTLDINLPKDQMEKGLTDIYKNVPGFEQAYKESVKINGQWYDLGQGYGAAGAKWQTPRINAGGESGGGGSSTGFVGGAGAAGFPSYGGYQEFAKTGGFSPEDIANMRARGVGGIRSAYAGAQREVQRGRALQGGYSPNAAAVQAKMAREQGQATSDATQNVEAGIADMRQKGRLSGLGGMFGVESLQNQNKWNALQGMSGLYGSSQNMAGKFGDQALQSSAQRDAFGQNQQRVGIEGQKLPGQWDTTMNRINDIGDLANTGIGVYNQFRNQRRKPLTSSRGPAQTPVPNRAPVTQNRP